MNGPTIPDIAAAMQPLWASWRSSSACNGIALWRLA